MCGRRSFALFFIIITCALDRSTCQLTVTKALECFNTTKPLECYKNTTGEEFRLEMDLIDGYQMIVRPKGNWNLDLKLSRKEELQDVNNSIVSSSRGMKKKMMNFIPYLIVPAFALAGIMPWILPPIKAAVMFVTMINNMAFSSALFMLIRNYIFNSEKDEHIIYVNHGYKDKNKNHR